MACERLRPFFLITIERNGSASVRRTLYTIREYGRSGTFDQSVLTVRNNTASTPGNAHLAVHEHCSSSSYSLVDKVTNAREVHE